LAFQIKKIQQRRTKLIKSQKKEIEAVKLFIPVVIAQFISNILPIIHTISIVVTKTWYRELGIAVGLSVVVNAAINFFIYWYQTSSFKSEVKTVFSKYTCWVQDEQVEQKEGKSFTETSKSTQDTNL